MCKTQRHFLFQNVMQWVHLLYTHRTKKRFTPAKSKTAFDNLIMNAKIKGGINPTNLNHPHYFFVGTYTAQSGQYFQNTKTNFLVKLCERKNPNALKPTMYLMTRDMNGKFTYLTSLYPRQGTHLAEIKGLHFIVEFPIIGEMVITAK